MYLINGYYNRFLHQDIVVISQLTITIYFCLVTLQEFSSCYQTLVSQKLLFPIVQRLDVNKEYPILSLGKRVPRRLLSIRPLAIPVSL
jgi:hypothetical protein